ncbi:MAG: hypothetical protein K9L17_04275 [Clostridiales bacterium]|nr:hypothetical protein [Clostridiales bacterium]MCF8021896.1 hypothetical protein [Clostridiales bacterium]
MNKKNNKFNILVKVIYSGDSALDDAYQFLAQKIINKEKKICMQQSMSE